MSALPTLIGASMPGGSAIPRAPRGLDETGLPFAFLAQLVAKILFHAGPQPLSELAHRAALPADCVGRLIDFLRREQLCEVSPTSSAMSVVYMLSATGQRRAGEYLEVCQYAGPAPVPLAQYVAQVGAQAGSDAVVDEATLAAALEGVVVPHGVVDRLGAALNSRRAVLLHGPAGSGKSYLAERLCGLLRRQVYVPHALLVDGQVIQVFDPLVHTPAPAAIGGGFLRDGMVDARWIACERPVVVTGGELSIEMLDLQFDRGVRYYVAPAQLKANNGLLVIDDLGRQLVEPRQLMNRWIVPLEKRFDYLKLHNGTQFQVPFDVSVVFCTNIAPHRLADDAFLRRLGYKIHVGGLEETQFRELWLATCAQMGVAGGDESLAHALSRFRASGRPLLGCMPRDLLSQIRDEARYRGRPPVATPALVDWAWSNYFPDDTQPALRTQGVKP